MVKRIEVCGNIASGKTTLVRAFENAGYACIFEDFSKIAYLDDFYKNPCEFAFETEIAFTLQHYHQIRKNVTESAIADFSLANDYAFALTTLSKEEFVVYEKMIEYIVNKVGIPEKIIFLDTSASELLNRIGARGRENEKSISIDYLNNVYGNTVKTLNKKFETAKIVRVNTEKIGIDEYSKDFLDKLLSNQSDCEWPLECLHMHLNK